jgi:hypothetical protein
MLAHKARWIALTEGKCIFAAMKCPHCLDSFHEQLLRNRVGDGPEGTWLILHQLCPACGKSIIILERYGHGTIQNAVTSRRTVYPKGTSRAPIAPEIDDPHVVNDYTKAGLVLEDSPEASAALSRRCLQHILREKAGTKKKDLADQIQEVLDSNALPTAIAENLDAVRVTGNFAAHPMKSTNTGEIIDVEPHEAEWDLDVLEQLMDFYYLRPAIAKKKRDEMNAKLAEAGKPPLK